MKKIHGMGYGIQVTVETGYGRNRLSSSEWYQSIQNFMGSLPNEKIHGMGYGITGTGYGRNGLR